MFLYGSIHLIGRRTRIMGYVGDMVGDMEELSITDFPSRESTDQRM